MVDTNDNLAKPVAHWFLGSVSIINRLSGVAEAAEMNEMRENSTINPGFDIVKRNERRTTVVIE